MFEPGFQISYAYKERVIMQLTYTEEDLHGSTSKQKRDSSTWIAAYCKRQERLTKS